MIIFSQTFRPSKYFPYAVVCFFIMENPFLEHLVISALYYDLQVASFLYHQEKMNVLVEPDVHDVFGRIPGFGFVQTFYIQDTRYQNQ